MKRKKNKIKKTIKRRISLENKEMGLQKPKRLSSVDERRKARIERGKKDNVKLSETPIIKVKSGLSVALANERYNIVGGGGNKPKFVIDPTYTIKDYGEYEKKENVDYDAIIYIPSFNRYKMINRLLDQLFNQETKYTFKVILMNDGSEDIRYGKLKNEYEDLIYLKNDKNKGRNGYWETTNKIFNEVKKYETHCCIQIDDDFMLCDNFLNKLIDVFFEKKEENNNYMAIRYHIGTLKNNKFDKNFFFDPQKRFQGVDGGTLFDPEFLKLFDFNITEISDRNGLMGSGVWNYINDKIIEFGVRVYTVRNSLAYHDGNLVSKMHHSITSTRDLNTVNFIDNVTGNNI